MYTNLDIFYYFNDLQNHTYQLHTTELRLLRTKIGSVLIIITSLSSVQIGVSIHIAVFLCTDCAIKIFATSYLAGTCSLTKADIIINC